MKIIETNFRFIELLSNRTKTDYIILHHAALNGSAETIHNSHIKKGYAGIGYHFYVRKDGSVYSGRPANTIGAHCLNNNYNSIGVCFEGNFENEVMNHTQMKAGTELVAFLRDKYPNVKVKAHRDMLSTACPGRNFPFYEISKGKVEKLTSANDITWELKQKIEISDTDGFVAALEKAKKDNSPLYWGFYKIVNS